MQQPPKQKHELSKEVFFAMAKEKKFTHLMQVILYMQKNEKNLERGESFAYEKDFSKGEYTLWRVVKGR